MEFGFALPNGGPLAKPEIIAQLAARGEALGFSAFAISDHIVFPADIASRYPYSPDGTYSNPQNSGGAVLEPLALLAFIAAVTKKAKLITSVLVVPYRHPVLAAKLLSTVDVLSNGRVVAGIGTGWMAEEFPPVGAPPFEERGKVTDEYIAVYRELWSKPKPSFKGKYADVKGILFEPKPVQKGGIPIWVGGESTPALRRAGRLGDAWYPIGCNPHYPMDTLARFEAGAKAVRGFAEEAGRKPSDVALTYWAVWQGGGKRAKANDGGAMLFTGGADDIAADIAAFRRLGVSTLMFNFYRGELQQTLDSMAWFADEVLPKLKG
ncbi:MAG: TIGR03619 family F420-dependent LLM class oxidoreductase [Alphaproteobacteria bacterium]